MNLYPISVRIIADSATPLGARMTTYELEFPRYIVPELLKHAMLKSNSQSSRAVPVKKTAAINESPVVPLIWGANVPGMQSKGELAGLKLKLAKLFWSTASNTAFAMSKLLAKVGLHKQWANRITEPFSSIKIILTATEFDNFFWLRLDEAAVQPEMYRLAFEMKHALDLSLPVQLEAGQWHVPFVANRVLEGEQVFFDADGSEISVEVALKISASCCAQVSYRNLDDSLKKAEDIFGKLFSGPRPHLSPTEHQGRVMQSETLEEGAILAFDAGVTALRKDLKYLSGNLTGFVQLRQLLGANENMFDFLKGTTSAD